MTKKYRVTLEAEEREQLRQLLAKGKADVRRRLKHAQVLLAADESPGGPARRGAARRSPRRWAWGARRWGGCGGGGSSRRAWSWR